MPYRNVQIFIFLSIKKGYYKFWWNQELDILNEKAISSHKVWKAAGKPPFGPIFQQLKSDKLAYKIKIREGKENEKFSYSNGLHDALSEKEGGECWKCWKAKFRGNNNFVSRQVNGLADKNYIAAKFAEHFAESCSPNCDLRNMLN